MNSDEPTLAECACLGCEFGSHSVDEIRAGRCSFVTTDIAESVKTDGWTEIRTAPPDGRSLYLCDRCSRQSKR